LEILPVEMTDVMAAQYAVVQTFDYRVTLIPNQQFFSIFVVSFWVSLMMIALLVVLKM
jgi:hypothetical protein